MKKEGIKSKEKLAEIFGADPVPSHVNKFSKVQRMIKKPCRKNILMLASLFGFPYQILEAAKNCLEYM